MGVKWRREESEMDAQGGLEGVAQSQASGRERDVHAKHSLEHSAAAPAASSCP